METKIAELKKRIAKYKKGLKAKAKLCPIKAEADLEDYLIASGLKETDMKLFLKLEDEIGIIIDGIFKGNK